MAVTDKDLFLAILAMDSYNRGYGTGLNDGGANDPDGLGVSGSIGTATIAQDSSTLLDASGNRLDVAAGFYAVAYETQYGTVISYRGTDFTPGSDLATDAHDGWTLGGGNFFAEQAAGCVISRTAR
jgi:hypothetical protein